MPLVLVLVAMTCSDGSGGSAKMLLLPRKSAIIAMKLLA